MTATDVRARTGRTAAPEQGAARRWSWVWFVLGAALLPFMIFQNVIPVAAWLAPALLLRFVRTQRARVALPLVALAGYGATLVSLRGFFFGPPEIFVFALGGAVMVLPYAADRLAAGRLGGFARTLVFPAVDTAAAFAVSLDQASPLGSWGMTGYTQVANLPLSQAASVVGVVGLSFVIVWTAAVVNDLWERGFDLRAARAAVVPFVVVLLAVLLLGGARLALSPATAPTVRVAALAPDRDLDAARDASGVRAGPRSADQRAQLSDRHYAPVLDDLFARSRGAARAGAQVVAWSEGAGVVFKEDEQALLDRAAAVAREEGIYLQLGMIFVLPETGHPTVENRSILVDPDGEVRWDYDKSTVVPGDGNALGSGVLPVVDTPFGRLSVAICFDADFPWLVRQAGRAGVDLLIVPSSDFSPAVAPMHADMMHLRAIENGVAVLRPTRLGTSLAIDPYGRALARSDYFTADDQTMLATLPATGVATPYRVAGDAVGWASIAASLVGAGVLGVGALRGVSSRRRARQR